MKKYLYYIFISLGIIFLLKGNTFAEAIIKKASGIKGDIINYELKWCPAHKSLIQNDFSSQNCYYGKFELDGNSALLGVKGVTASALIENFTNKITAFRFQAEGKIDVKLWAQDNAENLTIQSLSYMIDKTPPQLGAMGFSENSPYISVEDRSGKNYTVKIKAAISKYFGFNSFPTLEDYIDIPRIKTENVTQMKTIRYKVTGVPRNDNLTISLPDLTDSGNKLAQTNVSGLQKVELLMNNEVLKTYTNLKNGANTFTIQPRLIFNLSANSGEYVILRTYDNASNTADHVFYTYRDETVPLVNAMDFRLSGDDYNIVSQGSGLSPFNLANNQAAISYNWGQVNTHMADIIMKVEKDKDIASKNNYSLNEDESITHNTTKIELTDVDVDLFNPASGKNFRVYSVEFETPGIIGNKICDSVGNCINGEKILSQIRTIAGDISPETSTLQVQTPNEAFADNDSKYNFSLNLKDKYGNSIREVTNTGDGVIKTNLYTFNFENGLTQQLADNFSNSKINNPVSIQSNGINEIEDNKINSNISQVTFKEKFNSSNGIIDFNISSFVPTYGAYPFLKNNTIFAFDKTQSYLAYNQSITYDFDTKNSKSDFSYDLDYGTSSTITIDANLQELASDKYNMLITPTYGEVTNTFGNSFFKDIQNTKKLQLEFATPVLYHAKDFNILRDGIDSSHIKQVEQYGTNINSIKYIDKYFDIDNQNIESPKVDFYVNGGDRNKMSGEQNFNNSPYSAKYEAKEGQDFSKWGYVSYLIYNIGPKEIMLPAISRGIKSNSGNRLQSSAYFPSNVTEDEDAGTSFLTDDVAIDGLVNNIDGGARSDIDTQLGLVSLDLERPYTRAGLLENVKKKIFEINRQNRWCEDDTININFEDNNCTFNIEGEKITFIKGNVEITGGNVIGKRSIIVTEGSIEITGNITTKNNNGQLFVASISNKGLENITLGNNEEIQDFNKKGWISIDQKVTNIDAFVLAQGPLVSTNGGNIITNYQRDDQLLNQLHIYGSVFGLNTIGGSKTGNCPYIEQGNCESGSNESKVYDLSFLRRYTLIDGATVGQPNYRIPYNPNFNSDGFGGVLGSGGCEYFDDTIANQQSAQNCNSALRIPEKEKHWYAPVIIQRDQRWSLSPTYFSKED